MSKGFGSYELLDRSTDIGDHAQHERDIDVQDVRYERSRNSKAPLVDSKPTSTSAELPASDEKANVALERSIKPLLFSFLIHVLATISTIAIVQLSIFEFFWFDVDSDSGLIDWKGPKISLNELLNCIQFVAKIHEILMVGSLGAMVVHRVRNRLLGKHGLPFGMLAGGYSVGSAEYLLSSAFRSGFNRMFWPLSLLIFVFTLLANTLGPVSAIALVPSLDWWDMKNPFGVERLPIFFHLPKDQWWPLEITKEHTLVYDSSGPEPESVCFSSSALTRFECPVSGYADFLAWVVANANEAVPANVTVNDGISPAQRRIKSRLADRNDGTPGVAITTSLSQSLTTIMGSLWEQIRFRDFPVNNVVRPQMLLQKDQATYQPLVQVQCHPILLDDIHAMEDRSNASIGNRFINTFSTTNASRLPVPDWLYDYEYKPNNTLFLDGLGESSVHKTQAVNLTWMAYPDKDDFNLSIAAIVTTPMTYQDDEEGPLRQTAIFHFCSVDARWIASAPVYDPTEHLVLSHNITDPLLFREPQEANEDKYRTDKAKWGVSPALKLSTEWADSINIEVENDNITAPSFHWLLTPYITLVESTLSNETEAAGNETSQEVFFLFNPVINGNLNQSFILDYDAYSTSISETVSTILGLQLTDALARIQISGAQLGFVVTDEHLNDTHVSVTTFFDIAGFNSIDNTPNITKEVVATAATTYVFKIQRYGFGYGFRNATTYFGIAVLLAHSLLAVMYMIYATFDFMNKRWTSTAWGGVGEFTALLLNSNPSVELQNTCAGIDSKETWRKRVRIRETGDGHLGVVVGDEAMMFLPVRPGVAYGRLDEDAQNNARRRRRSV